MSYPAKDKFEYNISKRIFKTWYDKRPKRFDIDPEHPDYKYKYPNMIDTRVMTGVIQNPLGSLFTTWFTYQGYGFCAEIETRAMNCLEAYGMPQGMRKCIDLLEDYYECASGKKSEKRLELMRQERNRQFTAGERKVKYAVPPKLGTYQD